MKVLITGGTGFVGVNLAAHAIHAGIGVTVVDSLSRFGASQNLAFLRSLGEFEFCQVDVRDSVAIESLVGRVQPDAVFHLAGQVAMTSSVADPRYDFEVNALGTLNVLEAVRKTGPHCAVFYASTNKVYGDLLQYAYVEGETRYRCVEFPEGFDESVPLEFHSPYGCSKGCADQYVLDYCRMFGIPTVVFRHSSMYGGRQFATVDQGWVGWFCQKAAEARSGKGGRFGISGNGKQVRDLLHVEDVTRLYFDALKHIDAIKGHAFNVGGGMANSLSLLELFALLEEMTGKTLEFERAAPRHSDQLVFVADTSKLFRLLGWRPEIPARSGVAGMLEWVEAAAGTH